MGRDLGPMPHLSRHREIALRRLLHLYAPRSHARHLKDQRPVWNHHGPSVDIGRVHDCAKATTARVKRHNGEMSGLWIAADLGSQRIAAHPEHLVAGAVLVPGYLELLGGTDRVNLDFPRPLSGHFENGGLPGRG